MWGQCQHRCQYVAYSGDVQVYAADAGVAPSLGAGGQLLENAITDEPGVH